MNVLMKVLCFVVGTILMGCAHTSKLEGRWPASTETLGPATWDEALAACIARNAHLPTAREYVERLEELGIKVLESAQVTGTPPAEFYLVDSINPDGGRDAFYMSHAGYKRPESLTPPFRKLWTSSTPPNHQDFAHVFYEEWGGGGGDPKEHHKKSKNVFECFRD